MKEMNDQHHLHIYILLAITYDRVQKYFSPHHTSRSEWCLRERSRAERALGSSAVLCCAVRAEIRAAAPEK